MLILRNSCFLHVPKTGGTWVHAAIKASVEECQQYTINGDVHVPLEKCPCPEKFKIAFVRHPLDWYRSYWTYRMANGWNYNSLLDKDCCSDDFAIFCYKVFENYPGILSRGYSVYVGSPERQIEFIGRFENLVDDLIKGLKKAGERFIESEIRNLPPINVSNRKRFPSTITSNLKKAFKKHEYTALERFGYTV
jgi:hypothetical protein